LAGPSLLFSIIITTTVSLTIINLLLTHSLDRHSYSHSLSPDSFRLGWLSHTHSPLTHYPGRDRIKSLHPPLAGWRCTLPTPRGVSINQLAYNQPPPSSICNTTVTPLAAA
jgi:hypothetical protein